MLPFLQQKGIPIPEDIVCLLIENCTRKRDIISGKQLQQLLLQGDHFIRFFVTSKNLQEANKVFGSISEPTIYTWNAIIAAFSKNGSSENAFLFFSKMLNEGMRPNERTFVSILNACKGIEYLDQGHRLHALVEETELQMNAILCNSQ